jgi:hypothetical protein
LKAYLRAALAVLVVVALWRLSSTPATMDAIGSAATDIFRPLVAPLVDLLNSRSFVFVASALIFLSAPAVAAWYWLTRTRPRVAAYRASEQAIDRIAPQTAASWTSWAQIERQVSVALNRNETLLAPWAALTTEIVATGRYPNKPFRAFVAESPGGREQRQAQMLASLPGYYISIGLLLTFLGLVAALYFAARGFRAGDMDQARLAIVQLLNAASFKFLSSVAALAASLLLSVFLRFANGRIAAARDRLIDRIEALVTVARLHDLTGPSEAATLLDVVARLDKLVSAVTNLVAERERELAR